jgi:hypothetical protein
MQSLVFLVGASAISSIVAVVGGIRAWLQLREPAGRSRIVIRSPALDIEVRSRTGTIPAEELERAIKYYVEDIPNPGEEEAAGRNPTLGMLGASRAVPRSRGSAGFK